MKKQGKLSTALGAVILAGATTLIVASPAAADSNFIVLKVTTDAFGSDWGWSANDPLCEDPDISAYRLALDPTNPNETIETEIDSDRVTINDDRATGSFDISGLESGFYVFEIACETDNPDDIDIYQGLAAFAQVDVQKVVVGDASGADEFVINLTCETFGTFDEGDDYIPGAPREFDFTFGPQGGIQSIYMVTGIVDFLSDMSADMPPIEMACVVEETVDGGAESVAIQNPEIEILDTSIEHEGILFSMRDNTVVVTNTFAASTETPDEVGPDADEKPAPTPPVTGGHQGDTVPATAVKSQPTMAG